MSKRGLIVTFRKVGGWVEKPRHTETLVCACGNRYIKTRTLQSVCMWCMRKAEDSK